MDFAVTWSALTPRSHLFNNVEMWRGWDSFDCNYATETLQLKMGKSFKRSIAAFQFLSNEESKFTKIASVAKKIIYDSSSAGNLCRGNNSI